MMGIPFLRSMAMFGSLGMPELILIFVIALIVFGPRKLPELGRSLGRGIAEFKKASSDLEHSLEEEIRQEAQPPASKAPAPAASASPEAPHDATVPPTVTAG